MKLICGLDVGGFFEQGHQLGQVEELGKPCSCPVASAFRGQLDGCGGFTEGGGPAIEVSQTLLLDGVMLKVAHHGVQLGH